MPLIIDALRLVAMLKAITTTSCTLFETRTRLREARMPDPRSSVSITSAAKLNELIEHLRAAGQFALDTEFVSEDSFEPELGLIQVASRERLATIDPLTIPDLAPFWELVGDPRVEVVMHAPGEDLRIFKHKTGRLPARVVDVQRAAGLIGLNYPSGLGSLTSSCLRVDLEGRESRTDWRKRPLSPAQLRYALDDVRHLLQLNDYINGQLLERNRLSWAEEEFAALLCEIDTRDDSARWRRLPGLNQLNRRGLETARRLWHWRRDVAKQRNQPVRRVLRDDLLVALAKRQPTHRADLEALRDFDRPHLRGQVAELLETISTARAVPDAELPAVPDRGDELRASPMVVSVLTAVLHRCCADQAVSTALAGTASDLRSLVAWHSAGRPRSESPRLLEGWRREVCGEILVDVIAGNRSLRILDPDGEIPIAIDAVASRTV